MQRASKRLSQQKMAWHLHLGRLPQTNGMLSQKTRKMNYLYAPETVIDLQSIYQDLSKALGGDNRLAMFHEIKGLSARLRNFNNPEIVTLLAVKQIDLPGIIAMKDLFLDAAVIILLSDENQETLDLAIRLRPKFLGMINDDMDKIMPVVHKLIQKKRRI